MENKLCFVQFIHPGGEHRPDDRTIKRWNPKAFPHKRKFVKEEGRYVADGNVHEGVVAFWTEWEAESTVLKEIRDPDLNGPRYVYEPFYVVPRSYEGLQNTDPFVFGAQFHYTGCQQRRGGRPTQLRFLSDGSVILFGSCEDRRRFVLDTVFVVCDSVDHSKDDYKSVLRERISSTYADVTISPWYQESSAATNSCVTGNSQSWRLYFGATFENPVQGMFSYFPCVPFEPESKGFSRPVITLPGAITDNLYQSKRLNPREKIEEIKMLWDEVAAQVQDQGLALGVYAQMPPKKPRF